VVERTRWPTQCAGHVFMGSTFGGCAGCGPECATSQLNVPGVRMYVCAVLGLFCYHTAHDAPRDCQPATRFHGLASANKHPRGVPIFLPVRRLGAPQSIAQSHREKDLVTIPQLPESRARISYHLFRGMRHKYIQNSCPPSHRR
jgi:hypothetical protein